MLYVIYITHIIHMLLDITVYIGLILVIYVLCTCIRIWYTLLLNEFHIYYVIYTTL